MNKIIKEDIETIAKDIMPDAEKFSGKTILITGGAGFLGQYFISVFDYLNKNTFKTPCKIISADNFITGIKYWVDDNENFKSIKHDVKEPLIIDEPIDYIIHAAGIASPKFYRIYKIETIDVATLGTKNMLELAKEKEVESIIVFSSSEVYGDPDPRFIPTPETYNGNVSCTGPRSNYDESKRLSEALSVAYYETFETPVKLIRPFNVYGPGIRLDDARVVPNFVSYALEGKAIPVYGLGNHSRTFCYITDAMTGFFKVLLSKYEGESFNVGDDNFEVSIKELAQITKEVYEENTGKKVEISHVQGMNDAYASADPKRRCPDLTKVKTKTGYSPKVDIKTGIKRFLLWALDVV
ncbi:NAD-dependent epimerase/dehydratase family protein [archaeon]|jgi:UDP-glucuronate decarboxylase|nr:NAD-dependent epimerase/dehydratase family protein [archaeon]MBT4022243.1 NAD-dependent epimerase/dehydratase family protein [archaeon]MBT4460650.1 NAD-dependent epimerase/dehydratase family protein [archaeon]MBT5424528.1 NAD-dependent epimerase/dehydratase family protein [archaeon]MBT7439614.1 NAD-dependent epimerase/dehydratase family protein [archaeon]